MLFYCTCTYKKILLLRVLWNLRYLSAGFWPRIQLMELVSQVLGYALGGVVTFQQVGHCLYCSTAAHVVCVVVPCLQQCFTPPLLYPQSIEGWPWEVVIAGDVFSWCYSSLHPLLDSGVVLDSFRSWSGPIPWWIGEGGHWLWISVWVGVLCTHVKKWINVLKCGLCSWIIYRWEKIR